MVGTLHAPYVKKLAQKAVALGSGTCVIGGEVNSELRTQGCCKQTEPLLQALSLHVAESCCM